MPLPADVPVSALYAAVVMDGKGYLTRPKGESVWRSIEGSPKPGEKTDAAIKRLLKTQMAATIERTELIGFLECRATSFHPTQAAGDASVQPIYLLVAKTMGNMGTNAEWERRRLPLNEHIVALRLGYPLFEGYFGKTADRYAVLRARGEA